MSRIAFLFPGQGAQSVGMGADAARDVHAARELYSRANEILGYDLAKVCFEGPAAELDSTARSQPAIFLTSMAAVEVLRHKSPDVLENCQAVAGLSLGEYTALAFAGAFDFETGLRLVQARGDAMQAAADRTPSGMVSLLGLDPSATAALCDQVRNGEILAVANFLCPGNIVVSGSIAACARVAEAAPGAGAMKAISLAVAGAFHTSIMQPAVGPLAEALALATIRAPRMPVLSNVDAQPHADPDSIRRKLLEQVVQPVRWEECQRWLLAQGCDLFYEVGPGRVLRGLLKRIERRTACEGVIG